MPWSPLPTKDGPGGRAPAPLAGALDAVLAGLGGPSLEAIVLIHERWAEIVGPEVAPHAHPVSIIDGCLQIAVESPGWASHLRWAQAEILTRTRALLGADEVTDVAIRVARN